MRGRRHNHRLRRLASPINCALNCATIVGPSGEDRLSRTFALGHQRYTGFVDVRSPAGASLAGRLGVIVTRHPHLAHAMRARRRHFARSRVSRGSTDRGPGRAIGCAGRLASIGQQAGRTRYAASPMPSNRRHHRPRARPMPQQARDSA